MKYRMLKNGQKVAEASESVQMTIDSKCPKKWAFVDMETGDIWVHKSRYKRNNKRVTVFTWVDEKALHAIDRIITNHLLLRIGDPREE